MIQTYIFEWLIEATMIVALGSASYSYVKMKPRTRRARVGVVAVFALTLPVILALGIALAHPRNTNVLPTGLLSVILFEIFFVVTTISQWTLLGVTTRTQRIARRVFTGGAIFLGLVTLALLISLHS